MISATVQFSKSGENSEAGMSSQPAQQSGRCTACGTAQDCQSNSPLKADQPPGPEIPTILAPFSSGLPHSKSEFIPFIVARTSRMNEQTPDF